MPYGRDLIMKLKDKFFYHRKSEEPDDDMSLYSRQDIIETNENMMRIYEEGREGEIRINHHFTAEEMNAAWDRTCQYFKNKKKYEK